MLKYFYINYRELSAVAHYDFFSLHFLSQVKSETGKKQDVMTLSDSDDVQTISSGSDDNKEKEKIIPGE